MKNYIPIVLVMLCGCSVGYSLKIDSRKSQEEKIYRVVRQIGPATEVIELHIGEVLLVKPWSYALSQKMMRAQIDTKLSGDVVLEDVGQAVMDSEVEGGAGRSVVFFAQKVGDTIVDMRLLDGNGEEIRPVQRYKVKCEP